MTPNRLYEIDESAAVASPGAQDSEPATTTNVRFEDASQRLHHTHKDEPFDDLIRQPLLPKQLSQLGPGIGWFDLNGDGWDDLIVGSGRSGQLSAFVNDKHGGFQLLTEAPFTSPVTRDQTAVLGMQLANGKRIVLAGSSNYEDGLAAGPAARLYNLAERKVDDSLPGQPSSTGPLALADMNGDGELELFVGGRCIPGRYPEPASSLVLRQSGGRWRLDADNTRVLRNAGLVSGAAWSDLDCDGFPELLLACEWGPIRVFQNQAGRLRDATAELGLDKWTGWWTGIAAADLDGDGKPDIVAGNWGLNSSYMANPERPLRLYYGDIANRGLVDILEAEYDPASGQDAPRRMTRLGRPFRFSPVDSARTRHSARRRWLTYSAQATRTSPE